MGAQQQPEYDTHNLDYLDWSEDYFLDDFETIEGKIWTKHSITKEEVQTALSGKYSPVYEERRESVADERYPDDTFIYHYYGRTLSKYIFCPIIVEPSGRGILLTARKMDSTERDRYLEEVDNQ